MKHFDKIYGQALYKALAETKKDGWDKTLDNFLKILIDKNLLSRIDKIIDHFWQEHNVQNNIIEAKIQSTRELAIEEKEAIIDKLTKLTGKKIKLNPLQINPKIIGGLTIEFSDKLIDQSIYSRLKQIKNY